MTHLEAFYAGTVVMLWLTILEDRKRLVAGPSWWKEFAIGAIWPIAALVNLIRQVVR